MDMHRLSRFRPSVDPCGAWSRARAHRRWAGAPNLQYNPDKYSVTDRALSNAAGSLLVHRNYEEGNKGAVSADARKAALAAAEWPALTAEADRLCPGPGERGF